MRPVSQSVGTDSVGIDPNATAQFQFEEDHDRLEH